MFLGKFAVAAAVVGAAVASPALAVDTETFAQFQQADNAKIFQYRNITSGPNVASLSATGTVDFKPLYDTGLGSAGANVPVSISLNAIATALPSSVSVPIVGTVITQAFSGTLSFTLASPLEGINGPGTNALTVNFENALLLGSVNSGALSITFAPDTTSFMSSDFFDFLSIPILEENFALSFSSATKTSGTGSPFVLSGGRISSFNAAATGTFASSPPPVPVVPEPATWALMLLGFGVVGAGLRSRSRKLAAI